MTNERLTIVDIDNEGRGVAKQNEKVFFVYNALPGETVEYKVLQKKKNVFFATATSIFNTSTDRVIPRCPTYGICGGCSMQHFNNEAQIKFKEDSFFKTLQHIGSVKPNKILEPIYLDFFEYRHKARLRAKYVPKKNKVLVGFNERLTHFLTDMNECSILPKKISLLLEPLKNLLINISIFNQIPQIEYASNQDRDIFVLRILEDLTNEDLKLLLAFEKDYEIEFWTQTKGPETVKPLFDEERINLNYNLKSFGLIFKFEPTGFIQINPFINEVLISKAVDLLNLNIKDVVLDFFCGLGNFSLPIAKKSESVIGFEGSQSLVDLANENALINNLKNVSFQYQNLFDLKNFDLTRFQKATKWLIDPPRDGAYDLLKSIDEKNSPSVIVYVSCNPATLARDANILVNEKKYTLEMSGILNMFPNTSHIESISKFVLNE